MTFYGTGKACRLIKKDEGLAQRIQIQEELVEDIEKSVLLG